MRQFCPKRDKGKFTIDDINYSFRWLVSPKSEIIKLEKDRWVRYGTYYIFLDSLDTEISCDAGSPNNIKIKIYRSIFCARFNNFLLSRGVRKPKKYLLEVPGRIYDTNLLIDVLHANEVTYLLVKLNFAKRKKRRVQSDASN